MSHKAVSDEACENENSKFVGTIALTNNSATWPFVMSWNFWNYLAQRDEPCTAVVLNLYKHAEPLCSFPRFCQTPYLPNITESKIGLLQR